MHYSNCKLGIKNYTLYISMNKFKLQSLKGIFPKWYKYAAIVFASSIFIGYLCTIAFNLQFTFAHLLVDSVGNSLIIWVGCMAIVGLVWKLFPWERKPILHLLTEILLILVYLAVFISGVNYHNNYQTNISFMEGLHAHSTDIVFTLLITFLVTTIHEAVFFYKQWQLHFSNSIILEKDKLEAQYNALKAQVNPHFLFNSLNSLMSLLENNPKAEQYVQDLSDYLRYVLLSNAREEVTLGEEIENLEKFFHLQKLRFEENLHVIIEIQSDLYQYSIPPLVLQMLVDNCIKHNVISSKKPLYINIFSVGNRLTVQNNLQKKHTETSTGQGLKNIEGRFRFLSDEAMKIESNEEHFTVTIPLIKTKSFNLS
jgi:two-component system, LytTR family, sensor kinase